LGPFAQVLGLGGGTQPDEQDSRKAELRGIQDRHPNTKELEATQGGGDIRGRDARKPPVRIGERKSGYSVLPKGGFSNPKTAGERELGGTLVSKNCLKKKRKKEKKRKRKEKEEKKNKEKRKNPKRKKRGLNGGRFGLGKSRGRGKGQ